MKPGATAGTGTTRRTRPGTTGDAAWHDVEQMPHLKLELVDRFEDQVLNALARHGVGLPRPEHQATRRCARIAGRNFVPALAGRGHAALRVAASGAPTIARGTPRFPRGEPLQPELVRTPRPARLYVRTYVRTNGRTCTTGKP